RTRFGADPQPARGAERRGDQSLAQATRHIGGGAAAARDLGRGGAVRPACLERPVSYRADVVLETVQAPGERVSVRFGSGAMVPVDNTSTVEAASPVQLVLAALGGCSAIDVLEILRKKRQVVLGYEVSVEAERQAEHPRIFTRIEIVHRVR